MRNVLRAFLSLLLAPLAGWLLLAALCGMSSMRASVTCKTSAYAWLPLFVMLGAPVSWYVFGTLAWFRSPRTSVNREGVAGDV